MKVSRSSNEGARKRTERRGSMEAKKGNRKVRLKGCGAVDAIGVNILAPVKSKRTPGVCRGEKRITRKIGEHRVYTEGKRPGSASSERGDIVLQY